MLGLSNHPKSPAANSVRYSPGFGPNTPRFNGDKISKADLQASLDDIDLDSDYSKPEGDELARTPRNLQRQPTEELLTGVSTDLHANTRRDSLELKSKHQKTAKVQPHERGGAFALTQSTKKEKAVAKRAEDNSSDEEPIPVEKPPEDKFSRYEAEQQLIKQLEWGKKLEPLGRTLDWVTDQAKWASRRAAGVAQDLSASAPEMAGHAMVQFRKTAASQLKRLATALEVPESEGVESSNATISAEKAHHGHSRHEKK